MTNITGRDKLREAEREVQQRERVYARLVENGKLTRQKADRQIAIMEAIAADYRRQAVEEEQKGMLL